MEQFKSYVNNKNEVITILSELRVIIEELILLGAKLDYEVGKIDIAIKNIESDRVNIALIGSFSDGKTTAIAGMLRTVKDNMKIDTDESSNEIAIYDIEGFEDTCVVIDTPGLFGDKMLERDDQDILYSELTKEYISRAHIILFVLDATNPLKDSHYETVKWILKDLNKLKETIFVINKMDEVANLTDNEEFGEQEVIKKKVVHDRLVSIPEMTGKIDDDLNIVCISADPNERGLGFWFTKEDIYAERSRIDNLSLLVEEVLSNTSMKKLINKTGIDVVLDVCEEVAAGLKSELQQYDEYIETTENELERIAHEISVAETKIKDSRADFFKSLNNMENALVSKVRDLAPEEVDEFLDEEIGKKGDEFGQKLRLKIGFESEKFFDQSAEILDEVSKSIENHITVSEKLINDIVSKSLGNSGKVFKQISKVDEGDIKKGIFAVRDAVEKIFKKKIKFKPWGASKWAKRIAKYSGPIGSGAEVLMDFINLAQKNKAEAKLSEVKGELISFVKDYYGTVYDVIEDDDKFIEAYAPQIINFRQIMEKQQSSLSDLRKKQEYISTIDNKLLTIKEEITV